MAYQGEFLDACGTINVDLGKIAVVAVSGSGPNVCGHLLLYSPSRGGYYFHVASINDYPRYMSETGFRQYLRENGKKELRRIYLALPNPQNALIRLEQLISETWLWVLVPHNCVAFVEDVLEAGGAEWSSYSNCPALATADTVSERAGRFMYELEGEIYRLYGAPR
jgi:hypothetical protein